MNNFIKFTPTKLSNIQLQDANPLTGISKAMLGYSDRKTKEEDRLRQIERQNKLDNIAEQDRLDRYARLDAKQAQDAYTNDLVTQLAGAKDANTRRELMQQFGTTGGYDGTKLVNVYNTMNSNDIRNKLNSFKIDKYNKELNQEKLLKSAADSGYMSTPDQVGMDQLVLNAAAAGLSGKSGNNIFNPNNTLSEQERYNQAAAVQKQYEDSIKPFKEDAFIQKKNELLAAGYDPLKVDAAANSLVSGLTSKAALQESYDEQAKAANKFNLDKAKILYKNKSGRPSTKNDVGKDTSFLKAFKAVDASGISPEHWIIGKGINTDVDKARTLMQESFDALKDKGLTIKDTQRAFENSITPDMGNFDEDRYHQNITDILNSKTKRSNSLDNLTMVEAPIAGYSKNEANKAKMHSLLNSLNTPSNQTKQNKGTIIKGLKDANLVTSNYDMFRYKPAEENANIKRIMESSTSNTDKKNKIQELRKKLINNYITSDKTKKDTALFQQLSKELNLNELALNKPKTRDTTLSTKDSNKIDRLKVRLANAKTSSQKRSLQAQLQRLLNKHKSN